MLTLNDMLSLLDSMVYARQESVHYSLNLAHLSLNPTTLSLYFIRWKSSQWKQLLRQVTRHGRVRMLSERGQISAIQELANAYYLKRWPAMMLGSSYFSQ
jgi:hypothetical protein